MSHAHWECAIHSTKYIIFPRCTDLVVNSDELSCYPPHIATHETVIIIAISNALAYNMAYNIFS